jgi:hypothetical protein
MFTYMIVKYAAILRYLIVGVSLFIGFYFLSGNNTPLAVQIVCAWMVGAIGIISFFTHVVFYKQDATSGVAMGSRIC